MGRGGRREARWAAGFCLMLLLVRLLAFPAWAASIDDWAGRSPGDWDVQPAGPVLYAQAAILMDADTGQVLYEKNPHQRMEPASLTKLMTCLLAMEEGVPGERVTVTAEGLAPSSDSTAMGLREGEVLTLEQLLYGLMLPSANDAANTIAIHLAGSADAFVERMNQRAAELDLRDTHFVNAHGLTEEGHYASAYDLAKVTQAALEYPAFLSYGGQSRYVVPATAYSGPRNLTHLNRMLLPNDSYYDPQAIAGKTGWTFTAGHCLMTVAQRGESRLIAVVLQSDGIPLAAYRDTAALFAYGFTQFQPVTLQLPTAERTALLWSEAGEQGTYRLSAIDREQRGLLPPALLHRDYLVGLSFAEERPVVHGGKVKCEVLLLDAANGEVLYHTGQATMRTRFVSQGANAMPVAAVQVWNGLTGLSRGWKIGLALLAAVWLVRRWRRRARGD